MFRVRPQFTLTDTLFPYTSLFRSGLGGPARRAERVLRTSRICLARTTPVYRCRSRQGSQAPSCLAVCEKSGRSWRARLQSFGPRRSWSPRPQNTPGERSYRSSRSEEHTSELQSLMRNSYAVFCLKKKKQTTTLYIQYDQFTQVHPYHHTIHNTHT